MDNDHSTPASPRENSRPQHRPPSPPSPPAFENRAYLHDEADQNHNDSFTSTHQNGHSKEPNGQANGTKTLEAVNLELINLTPKNGNAKKKDVEVEINATNPYEEYFVPVNEHRKYMRGEKLYVTADKRGEKSKCKRPLCWTLLALVIAAIVALIVLAATGVLFANSPTEVNQYNSSVSSARAFGGFGSVPAHDHNHNQDHDHDHEHDEHDHSHHDHDHSDHTTQETQSDQSEENNVSMHVPETLEGEIKINNMEFTDQLNDPNSEEYRQIASEIARNMKNILENAAKDGMTDVGDIRVEVVQLRKGSVVVTFRVHWTKKNDSMTSQNPMTAATLKRDLQNYLESHNSMISSYSVVEDYISVNQVTDLCQSDLNGCEYGCSFDKNTLDFMCTCPDGQILDSNNPKICVYESDIRKEYRGLDLSRRFEHPHLIPESEPTTEPNAEPEPEPTTEPKTEPEPSAEPKAEPKPTTETQAEPEPNAEPKVEPEPTAEPKAEPEPTAEPKIEPEPSEEPKVEPEPSTESQTKPEPNAEPEATAEPKAEPESTAEPKVKPELSTESKAELEPTVEPKVEPEPTAEPKVEPEPTAEPKMEPEPSIEPKTEPEPTTESKVKPEPTTESQAKLETNAEPEVELEASAEPKLAPESTSESQAEPEPTAEPQVEPETNTEHKAEAEPTAEPKVEQDLTSEPNTELEPNAEPKAEPEPTAEPKTEPKLSAEPSSESNAEPEPTAEPKTEPEPGAEPKIEPGLSSKSKAEPTTGSKQEIEATTESNIEREADTGSKAKLEFTVVPKTEAEPTMEKELDAETKTEPTTESMVEQESTANVDQKTESESTTENKPEHTVENAILESHEITDRNLTLQKSSAEPVTSVKTELSIENAITSKPAHIAETTTKDLYIESAPRTNPTTKPKSEMNTDTQSQVLSTTELQTEEKLESEHDHSTPFLIQPIREPTGNVSDIVPETERTTESEPSENSVKVIPTEYSVSYKTSSTFDDHGDHKETTTESEWIQDVSQNENLTHMEQTTQNAQKASEKSLHSDGKDLSESQKDNSIEERRSFDLDTNPVQYITTVKTSEQVTENFINAGDIHAIKTNEPNSLTTEETHTENYNADNEISINRSSKSIEDDNTKKVIFVNKSEATTTESDWLSASVTNMINNGAITHTDQTAATDMTAKQKSTENNYEKGLLMENISNEITTVHSQAEPTTVSEYIYKMATTTEAINKQQSNDKTIFANPAPVWEEPVESSLTESHSPQKSIESKPERIDTTASPETTVASIVLQDIVKNEENKENENKNRNQTTINVTIYEKPPSNENESQKPTVAHSAEYVDQEKEHNPFLPEAENNHLLVQKLQEEGHDLEPNMNETQNDSTDEHSAITTDLSASIAERKTNEEIHTTPEQTSMQNDMKDTSNSGTTTINTNVAQSESVVPLATFFTDTDDLNSTKGYTSKSGLVETTTLSEKRTESNTRTDKALSVVPITEGKLEEKQTLKKNYKSDNSIQDLNDIE